MNYVIEVVEVYAEPGPQRIDEPDEYYAAYLKDFYSRPLSERLVHSTTLIHQWR